MSEPSAKYLVRSAKQRTDIGVLPLDWKLCRLGEITKLMTNGFVGTATKHYAPEEAGAIYIQGFNVEENAFNLSGVKYVTEAFHRAHQKSCLREGDLLTVQTGDVGLTTVVPPSLVGANCHALIISRLDRAVAEPRYVSQYLNCAQGRARLKLIETGTTMKHLNVGDMLGFLVPQPPISEQREIAESLTDADALIDSLEQLLAKKRQIKQGAMQELITGKRRLPGFTGQWKAMRLGDIGRTYGGLTGKSKADFGHGAGKYVTFMNVMTNTRTSLEAVESVHVEPTESQNNVQPGDLLFNGSSETPEEVAFCSWVEDCAANTFLNSFCFGFRPSVPDQISGLFMAYYFRSRPGRMAVSSLAQGATRYNIAKTALLQAPLSLPAFDEQQAIASILSAMDEELSALESRLTKARALKRAMAQALLTGRIRLVEPTA